VTTSVASKTETKSADAEKSELRGQVLDVLKELLAGRRDDEVLKLVEVLVSRNRELELLLAKMRASKNASERISADQLDLFLNKLKEQTSESNLAEANEKLEKAAENNGGRTKPPKPPSNLPCGARCHRTRAAWRTGSSCPRASGRAPSAGPNAGASRTRPPG